MSRRHKLPLFDADMEAKAEAFHAANPHVYVKLRELAFQARNAGAGKLGIATLFEQLRWFSRVNTTGDRYLLNNSFRAYFARRLMKNEPELDGLFVTRDAAFDPEHHERKERRAS